jgi:hypothetical protein
MISFFRMLAASRRFGRATRLQSRGELNEALDLLTSNRATLGSVGTSDVPTVSLRLMNLIHLAEAAQALERSDLSKSALEEWLAVWEAARRDAPALASVESLAKQEKWVRATLTST